MIIEEKSSLNSGPLGETGHQITRLGLGAAHLGGELDEEVAVGIVRRSLDRGIRFIDTAPLYGDSERRIGVALRDHPASGEMFIATKVGLQPGHVPDYTYDGTMRMIETSLERLGQPMLHLVQIHEIQDEHWAQVWSSAGAVAALQRAKDQHLIGHVGVTGSDPAVVARAIETDVFETALIWGSFHLLDQEIAERTLDLAAQRNMGVVVGSPFGGSILATGTRHGPRPGMRPQFLYQDADDETVKRVQELEEFCGRNQLPLRALALQFILRDPRVSTVIPGAIHPCQVDQLVADTTNEISSSCWDELNHFPKTSDSD